MKLKNLPLICVLLLIYTAALSQTKTKVVYKNLNENILVLDSGQLAPPVGGDCNCPADVFEIRNTVTVATGLPAKVTLTKVNGKWLFDFEIPQGPKGDPGRGISSTVVDPTTGILTVTYTDGTKYISQSLTGPPGPSQCTNCTSGGTGSGTKEYWVTDFGAKGDGVTDDTQSFRNAIAQMITNRGKLVVPAPANFFKITGTLLIKANNTFARCEIASWGWGNGTNTIRYSGPSFTSVISLIDIKQILVTGLSIGVDNGRDHVVLYDLDTQIGSSTGPTFKSMYLDLNSGVYNVAFRLGHLSLGGADISNVQWENVAVYGQRKEGQIAYQIEGQNTLSQTWMGGFVAFCHKAITNVSSAGAKNDRGNGSIFIFGLGCSQNILDFDFNFEQTYTIIGGRFEGSYGSGQAGGGKFMNVGPHAYHASVTVIGAHISQYDPPDGNLITFQTGGSLSLIEVEGHRNGPNYGSIVALGMNINPNTDPKGVLHITGGAFSAAKGSLYKHLNNAARWKKYVSGASKYNEPVSPSNGNVYTFDWFDDVNGQIN